jgi:hypothetical protein
MFPFTPSMQTIDSPPKEPSRRKNKPASNDSNYWDL